MAIRVLIAKPGLDGHDRGALVIAQGLRDAGMEVIYTGIRQTPKQIVAAAIQEDVACIGLSSLSGAHMNSFLEVARLLREQNAENILLIGGGVIPDEDVATLKGAGVSEVFLPGSTIASIAKYIEENVKTRDLSFDIGGCTVKGVHHVGVLVNNIDDILPFYLQTLVFHVVADEQLTEHGVRSVILAANDSLVELIEPIHSASSAAKQLASRGPGVHHIAYEVEDLEACLARLTQLGMRLVDSAPRVGAQGHLVAFVHPKSTGGALTELVQTKRGETDAR